MKPSQSATRGVPGRRYNDHSRGIGQESLDSLKMPSPRRSRRPRRRPPAPSPPSNPSQAEARDKQEKHSHIGREAGMVHVDVVQQVVGIGEGRRWRRPGGGRVGEDYYPLGVGHGGE